MRAEPTSGLFQTYHPRNFCREFVAIRGSSNQLLLFMALVLGHKPLMDDWVPRSRLEEYRAMCRRYRIHLRVESTALILARSQVPAHVVGGSTLTSTRALGFPPEVPVEGRVHVFLSRNPELLQHGMWYPLIVKDRVIWPPLADTLRFGHLLGYPECCIRFFRQRNDWTRYSFLYEIYRNTPKGRYRLLCNPLTKDCTYSYIYHMPCRFDCPATLRMASRLRREVQAREPELVRQVDEHLKLPALVFYERKLYVFRGRLKGSRLDYTEVHYPDGDPDGVVHLARLRRGDRLELRDGGVDIYRDGEAIDRIEAESGGFAPETPFLVQFR